MSKDINKKNNNKNKKRKLNYLKLFLCMFLIILLGIITYFVYGTIRNGGGLEGFLSTAIGQSKEEKENLEPISVLLLGSSQNLTDTIIVAKYNPHTQSAYLISIPRDTYTGQNKNTAQASDKINSIYQGKYPEKTLKAVNSITGLNLKYYAVIDTVALRELVDTIGGVYFDVPIDMHYTDKKQDLYIDLKAGYQLLDGNKAEQVVRFRHNSDGTTYSAEYGDNDIGRMKTQRNFLKAVMKQTLKLENIKNINNFVNIIKKYVDTNIPTSTLLEYVPSACSFNIDNLETGTLKGFPEKCNGVWLFINNKPASKSYFLQLNNRIDGIETNNINISDLKIEILNGSGSQKKLKSVVSILKNSGFNITKTGSTKSTSKTTITNRSDLPNSILENIKTLLSCGTFNENPNTSSSQSSIDITIVIGKDYIIEN